MNEKYTPDTPLRRTAENGFNECIKQLVQTGADVNGALEKLTPLMSTEWLH